MNDSPEARWQAALIAAIEGRADDGFDARGLAVYRNNYRVGLADTLAYVYPVVKALVGDDFFAGLAREYVGRTPSRSGDLHRYGDAFGDFLAGFEPARALPYLADTARLEWLVHRAYYAPDAAPLAPDAFAALAEADWPRLRFALAPGVAVFSSPYPVGRLWLYHQPGAPADWRLEPDAGGDTVRVARRAGRVEVGVPAPADAAWLAALAAGDTLEAATDAALDIDAGFDLEAALVGLLRDGLIARLLVP
ncbi:putative DNA-binding protein [Crenobacter luteus]|uniref:HvfC/BufC N-terminal domain-containing protein n=1 Tax=Crenobacter luteus TaxID=1452487 RepID=UPI00104BFA5F|nr:DNA-binding domain-containing protein [Crenobacter luteus]TCP15519.1 putative DNA-binding protein [Crenobacter luteus]